MKNNCTLCFTGAHKKTLIRFLIFCFLTNSMASNSYAKNKEHLLIAGRQEISKGQETFAPVILTPMKGYYSKGRSFLTWTSLQESNSGYFEIQRSNDGNIFYNVGKVTAAGNSDKEVDYSFQDLVSTAGMNYYRLKLTDKDGGFQYSNIVALNVTLAGIEVTAIYPAPFENELKISVSSDSKSQGKIELFDNTGRLVISQQIKVNKGLSTITIDQLGGLVKGVYFIKVWVGETFVTKKIIK